MSRPAFSVALSADSRCDQALETLRVEPRGLAGPLALPEQGMTDIVGVLAALGLGDGEGLAAGFALGQPADQVRAERPAGMHTFGCAGPQ